LAASHELDADMLGHAPSHSAISLHELRFNQQAKFIGNVTWTFNLQGCSGLRQIPDEAINRRRKRQHDQAAFERPMA
jgi:hypothetical protein